MTTTLAETVVRQKKYFESGATLPISFRIEQLKKLREIIRQNENRIAEALHSDLHKSAFESYATETGLVLKELNHFIRQTRRWANSRKAKSTIEAFPSCSYIIPEPRGVCLIIAPWNYPFQLCMAPLIAAMAAGNCAVVKPSELSTNTAVLIEEIINRNFSPDFIRVINGDTQTTSELLQQPFDMFFFTGSPRVGKIVMQVAAEKLIPVVLELGGKSPVVVDESANVELAARRIIWGKSINAGQTCIAPDYVLVHKSIEKELIAAMKFSITDFFGTDQQKSHDFARIIHPGHFHRLKEMLNDGNVVFGGEVSIEERFIGLTLITQPRLESVLMQEEIFGPLLPIVTFEHLDEAIKLIRSKSKPLALYIFSKRKKVIHKLLQSLSAGGVTINDTMMHFTNSALPFGGAGFSGIGSYHGKAGFDAFSHLKPVMKRALWLDIPLRYPPFGNKLRWIKKLMR
ncbi:MAG: aldehyde dehydrogenase [Bacteroidales bacterium]|nr:aldehyde dehydrogenase [Bacteroidales bacterium]